MSLSRSRSSSAMISPWKSGLVNPNTMSCTGPMAIATPLSADQLACAGRPDDGPALSLSIRPQERAAHHPGRGIRRGAAGPGRLPAGVPAGQDRADEPQDRDEETEQAEDPVALAEGDDGHREQQGQVQDAQRGGEEPVQS